MGTRQAQEQQEEIWIANVELARSPGHPFYERLNELLDGKKFDRFVEGHCRKFYAPRMGRLGLARGIYFRSLLIGYFEGIDSERGMAGRAADAGRSPLAVALDLQEHNQSGGRVEPDGTSGQSPNGRAAAERGRLQFAEHSQDERRSIASGPQCPVRVYNCHREVLSAARSTRHFGGHEE